MEGRFAKGYIMFVRTAFVALLVSVLAANVFGQAPTLTISSNNTPLDRRLVNDVSKEALRRLGYQLNLVRHPSERSLHLANEGEVDGEGFRVAGLSAQYPNLLQVPERYGEVSFVAFTKGEALSTAAGWEGLRGKRVAYITGWKLFESNVGAAQSVVKVDKAEQMFQMLDSGRIDVALYTLRDGVALVRELGLNAVQPVAPALKNSDMFLYLHRRHEALVPRLTQVLREMKADGSYARLVDVLK